MPRIALLPLLVACGQSAGGGALVIDAAAIDGRSFPDAAPRVDGGSMDAATVVVDASTLDGPDGGCGPLRLDVPAGFVEHSPLATTDLAAAVDGTGPFTCSFYTGVARGTRPAGTALTGCALAGGAGPGQAQGQYGFIVVVRDACGDTVDVPVAMQHGACTDLVTMTPPPSPVRVPSAPTAGYGWGLQLDLDLVANAGGGCGYCFTMQATTRAPAQISQNLDCANPGTICSDCDGCVGAVTSCSAPVTMERQLTVKPHDRLRPAGSPGWLTIDMGLVWSGDSRDPCGGNEWTCHVESFEP
jgi:hypothetical protein